MAKFRKLSNLVVNEISLVDSPANPGARVLLTKMEDMGEYGAKDFGELYRDPMIEEEKEEAMERVVAMANALLNSIYSISEDQQLGEEEKRSMFERSFALFQDAMNGVKPSVAKHDAGKPGKNQQGKVTSMSDLEKRLAGLELPEDAVEDIKKAFEEGQSELTETVETLKAEIAELKKGEEAEEEINKAELPEPVRKQLEAIEKANAELSARVEKAERKEAIEEITKDLGDMAFGETDELANAVYAMRKGEATEAEADVIVSALKAANAQLENSELFKAAGTDKRRGVSAVDEINALAAEMVTKGESKSIEQARVSVRKNHPELAKRERTEGRK